MLASSCANSGSPGAISSWARAFEGRRFPSSRLGTPLAGVCVRVFAILHRSILMTNSPSNDRPSGARAVRLLFFLVAVAILAAICLVSWAVEVRTSPSAEGPESLLAAIASARTVGTAATVRENSAFDANAAWIRAVDAIIAESASLHDDRLAKTTARLTSTVSGSTVTRLSALDEVEAEARAAFVAAQLETRRTTGQVWLISSIAFAGLALLVFAALTVQLTGLAAERSVLDRLLPLGHPSEGLVTRVSRLTGRASSLVERQSSLVSERFGLVRALADLEENEQRLVSETRLHRDEIERLQVSQMRDELTGVLNFKYFLMRLSEALDEFIDEQRPFCLLALDLDDFKGINDGYGHHVGDAALRAMGRLLNDGARDGEIVFRKSGDEFYVLMPGATAAEAVARAESLLAAVNGHEVSYEAPDETYRVHLATSIGVLHCEQVDKKLLASLKRDQLLSETYGFADAALFKAKYSGKGCARIYTTGLTVVEVNPKEFPPDFDALHRGLKSKYPLLPDAAKDEFNVHLAAARRILSGR